MQEFRCASYHRSILWEVVILQKKKMCEAATLREPASICNALGSMLWLQRKQGEESARSRTERVSLTDTAG